MADTTIRLTQSTAKRLKALGHFGESWDDLLNRLADCYEECEEEEDEDEEE